jgi:hypothetical protein
MVISKVLGHGTMRIKVNARLAAARSGGATNEVATMNSFSVGKLGGSHLWMPSQTNKGRVFQ